MRLLELFAGTGSIGRAFADQGWEVTSLDIDPKSEANLITDFMLWQYWKLPKGHFDAIWASPVCTHYSCARTTGKTPRDLEGSDRMVERVLDCLDLLDLRCGLLKTLRRAFSRTGWWWRVSPARTLPTVCTGTPTESLPESGLTVSCGSLGLGAERRLRARSKVREMNKNDKCSLRQLYSMPEALCQELAQAFSQEALGA